MIGLLLDLTFSPYASRRSFRSFSTKEGRTMETTNVQWPEVAARIAEDDRGKWDRKVPATQLWIGDNGELTAMNGGPAPDAFTLSDLATSQLCERLGVPTIYYRLLPSDMKA